MDDAKAKLSSISACFDMYVNFGSYLRSFRKSSDSLERKTIEFSVNHLSQEDKHFTVTFFSPFGPTARYDPDGKVRTMVEMWVCAAFSLHRRRSELTSDFGVFVAFALAGRFGH